MCIVNMWSDMMKQDMDLMKNFKQTWPKTKLPPKKEDDDESYRKIQDDEKSVDILC